ncbi:hypothetical protein D047_0623A, partial [Vibrio parahaemolyticus VPTS-2010_2]
MVELF